MDWNITDEGLEGEEDIVLPSTELGKYLENQNVFGHFECALSDRLDSHSIIHQTWSSGFICGQKIKQNFHPVWLQKLFTGPNWLQISLQRACSVWFQIRNLFFEVELTINRMSLKASRLFWPLSNRKAIAHRFSLEHRLSTDCLRLKECSSKVDHSISHLNSVVLKLQGLMKVDPTYKNQVKESSLEIVRIRSSIKFLMEDIDKLLVSQANSIQQLSRRLEIPKITPDKIESSVDDIASPLDVSKSSDDADDSVVVFETDVVMNGSNTQKEYICGDEVFELKLDTSFQNENVEFDRPEDENLSKELKSSHAELMVQLRHSLLSRRADMKARENQAYIQLYGKLPDDQQEHFPESSVSRLPQESLVQLSTNLNNRLNKHNSDLDETYGDEIDKDEENEVKSEFLLSLQNLLKKGGCIGDGIESYS